MSLNLATTVLILATFYVGTTQGFKVPYFEDKLEDTYIGENFRDSPISDYEATAEQHGKTVSNTLTIFIALAAIVTWIYAKFSLRVEALNSGLRQTGIATFIIFSVFAVIGIVALQYSKTFEARHAENLTIIFGAGAALVIAVMGGIKASILSTSAREAVPVLFLVFMAFYLMLGGEIFKSVYDFFMVIGFIILIWAVDTTTQSKLVLRPGGDTFEVHAAIFATFGCYWLAVSFLPSEA